MTKRVTLFAILILCTISVQAQRRVYRTPPPQNTATVCSNNVGMQFVPIPAGSFKMGSALADDEKPVHVVTIAKPFYMGKFEVTQKQWKAIMRTNPSTKKGDNLPVEFVSWNDVQEFLKRMNAQNVGCTYRLPSEAEWEYACRAGLSGTYCFGNNQDLLNLYAWPCGPAVHPVGLKKPNRWGLYDMLSNVDEWCQDTLHDSYVGAPADGSAWQTGGGNDRVLRGGSVFCVSQYRAAEHYGLTPDVGNNADLRPGFRVVAVARGQ